MRKMNRMNIPSAIHPVIVTKKLKNKKLHEIIHFLEQAGDLKTTLRFGSSLKSRESTASHSWRVALMAFLLAEELKINVNLNKVIKLALVHDIAEAITGDIDAVDIMNKSVSKKEKRIAEQKAIQIITQKFSFGNNLKQLWEEYDSQKTKEAKFVKAIDKIEAYLHIKEAGHKEYIQKEFFHNYADQAVNKVPELSVLLKMVKTELKQELTKGKIKWKKHKRY